MTSASKHIVRDQYDKVRVHSTPPGQVDCGMNSIKSFQGPKVKRRLAEMSESVREKKPKDALAVMEPGFNCRCTHANNSNCSAQGEFVKGGLLCLRLKSEDVTPPSPVQTGDFLPCDVCIFIDSCPFESGGCSAADSALLFLLCSAHHSGRNLWRGFFVFWVTPLDVGTPAIVIIPVSVFSCEFRAS